MSRLRITVVLFVALAGLWAGCGGPRLTLLDPSRPVGPRPSHFGIALPVPVSAMPLTSDTLRTGQAERRIPVRLQVDLKGRVGAVVFASPDDSVIAAGYLPFLKSIRFEPGRRDTTVSEMSLRVDLQIGGPGSEAILNFPVGPNREIKRADTYWAAIEAVGTAPARLTSFPSYYYIPSSAVTGSRYDYKLFRIEIDSLGRVTAIDPVFATIPRFTDQISSAARWATYEPMRVAGRPVASTNFLAIALFSEAVYPTKTWYSDSLTSISDKERLRVRLLADTVGEMFPAIVKRDWSGPIIDSAAWESNPQLLSARITVDTAGVAALKGTSVDSYRVRRMLMGRALDRRFYPARDFSGVPVSWPGLAYIRYLDRSEVKAWFDWAPLPDSGERPK